MEIDLKGIDRDADIYDIYEGVALVLHGPELYDPNDRRHKGRKPNFEIVPGESPAGRIHNGTALLRVSVEVGRRLFRWLLESPNNTILVGKSSRALRAFSTDHKVPPEVNYRLEKVLYIDPSKEKERKEIEDKARQVRLRIAKVQFGVWYIRPESNSHGRTFSVEHEREFINQSAAYLSVVYERRLICIDVSTSVVMRLGY
jgi:RNA-dependent RNA polymerase